MDENHKNLLKEAENHLAKSKRLFFISTNLLNNNRIFSKVILELVKALINSIEFCSQTEKFRGKDKKFFFFKKISSKYIEEGDRKNLIDLLIIAKRYKVASMEFSKGNKLVIFSEDDYVSISKEKVKGYISSVENLIFAISSNKKHKYI
jgi:hypothetical protein